MNAGIDKFFDDWCECHDLSRDEVIQHIDAEIQTSPPWEAVREIYTPHAARVMWAFLHLSGQEAGDRWSTTDDLANLDLALYLPPDWQKAVAAGHKCLTAGQANRIPADVKARRKTEAEAAIAKAYEHLPAYNNGKTAAKKWAAKKLSISPAELYRRLS